MSLFYVTLFGSIKIFTRFHIHRMLPYKLIYDQNRPETTRIFDQNYSKLLKVLLLKSQYLVNKTHQKHMIWHEHNKMMDLKSQKV